MDESRVVLVVGGTSGIGLQTAEKFLREGDQVLLFSVDDEKQVNAALCRLQKTGDVSWRHLDVTDHESCEAAMNGVLEEFDRIDVLVNAAGVRGRVSKPTQTDFFDLQRTMQVNFMGAVYVATAAARHMMQQGFGTIIQISSISGSIVTADDYGYHCSKSALNMATQLLAKEVAPYGVRCLAIAPGGVRTGMNSSEWEKEGKKLHIRNRLLYGEEIANLIYLMTRPEASCVNGSVLMADDGYTAFKGIF